MEKPTSSQAQISSPPDVGRLTRSAKQALPKDDPAGVLLELPDPARKTNLRKPLQRQSEEVQEEHDHSISFLSRLSQLGTLADFQCSTMSTNGEGGENLSRAGPTEAEGLEENVSLLTGELEGTGGNQTGAPINQVLTGIMSQNQAVVRVLSDLRTQIEDLSNRVLVDDL